MKIYNDIEQRSLEWYELRWRRITGSEFRRAMGTQKAKETLAKQKRYELDNPVEVPRETTAKPLLWGIKNEPLAIAHYELLFGEVSQPGFIVHPEYDFIGFSPDGISNMEKGVEVKCPFNQAVHDSTRS